MERSDSLPSERELWGEFVRTGREELFDALVQRYRSRLLNLAFRVLYDRQTAEDVVQRVFIRLLERRDKVANVGSIQSWLYRTTLNLSFDLKKSMRRRKRRESGMEIMGVPETPREAAAREELRKELDGALAKLKDSLRVPLVLRYLQGLSHEETSEVLNSSSDAVRMRINRALKKLKGLLKKRGLLLSLLAVEEGLRSIPAEIASASLLTSAAPILKAASGAGAVAKAVSMTAAAAKGGLAMTAKTKIAIGLSAAILAGGTATYIAMRGLGRQDKRPRATGLGADTARIARGQSRLPGGQPEAGQGVEQEIAFFGQVIDPEEKPIPGAIVEAGVFEGESPNSLSRKVLVHSTTTDSSGGFELRQDGVFPRARELLMPGEGLPRESSKELHGLLIASKDGRVPERQAVSFQPSENSHKIVLKKAPEVTGRVVWKGTDRTVPGIGVGLRSEESDLYEQRKAIGHTDESGSFALAIAAEGTAWVQAEDHKSQSVYWRSEAKRMRLVAGQNTADVVLEVEQPSETLIEGRVLNEGGYPVTAAEVYLSMDRRVLQPARSGEDGRYRIEVPKDWPYQSYFVEDWPDKPEISTVFVSSDLCIFPKEGGAPVSSGPKWEWTPRWIPPLNAPPERLVAYHPDYEMAVVEVPRLGVGQVRRGVDIVLCKASKVSGRVLDDDSQPLAAAQIRMKLDPSKSPVLTRGDNRFIQDKRIGCAADGSYEIRFLREGSYELLAACDECDPQTKRLDMLPHQIVEGFDFVLTRWKGFIHGKVLDESGNPWANGRIKADVGEFFGSGEHYEGVEGAGASRVFHRHRTAEINNDGSYELSRMQPGKYNIWLAVSPDYPAPEGILQATSLRDIPTGTEGADLIVRKLPAGGLRVCVVDEAHRPISKFEIVCCPLKLTYGRTGIEPEPVRDKGIELVRDTLVSRGMGDSYVRDAKYSRVLVCRQEVVSDGGEFVAERVAPGTYFVSTTADKRGEEFAEVEIEGGRRTEATLELQALGRLEGIVVDSKGHSLEGILIRAVKKKDVLHGTERVRIVTDVVEWESLYGGWWPQIRSGRDGRFVVENLEQTDYRVIAWADYQWTILGEEGRSVFADVTIGPGGRDFVRLVFEDGSASIAGFVYGEDGNPAQKAEVILEGDGKKSVTHADEQGRYAFPNLLPGKYLVRAQIGGSESTHFRGREVDLNEGEQGSVDITAAGDGGIAGTVSLAGDAARAAAWFLLDPRYPDPEQQYISSDKRLVLREAMDSGTGKAELRLPVGEKFEFKNIPAGTYEARAHYVLRVSPEPLPIWVSNVYLHNRPCYAKFASKPEIVRVSSGSSAALHLTISDACALHYPIPDPASCDRHTVPEGWRSVLPGEAK